MVDFFDFETTFFDTKIYETERKSSFRRGFLKFVDNLTGRKPTGTSFAVHVQAKVPPAPSSVSGRFVEIPAIPITVSKPAVSEPSPSPSHVELVAVPLTSHTQLSSSRRENSMIQSKEPVPDIQAICCLTTASPSEKQKVSTIPPPAALAKCTEDSQTLPDNICHDMVHETHGGTCLTKLMYAAVAVMFMISSIVIFPASYLCRFAFRPFRAIWDIRDAKRPLSPSPTAKGPKQIRYEAYLWLLQLRLLITLAKFWPKLRLAATFLQLILPSCPVNVQILCFYFQLLVILII